jgi:hypothetical protein
MGNKLYVGNLPYNFRGLAQEGTPPAFFHMAQRVAATCLRKS